MSSPLEQPAAVPPLAPYEGSWVVTSPAGRVLELWTPDGVRRAVAAGWQVETIGVYLARVNRGVASKNNDT